MAVVVGCGTRYNTRGSIHNQQIRVVGIVVVVVMVVRRGTHSDVVFIVSQSEQSAEIGLQIYDPPSKSNDFVSMEPLHYTYVHLIF